MRVITMYLPQFHCIRENDEWWGEGFTEWTAVKGAEPLFKGHEQPRVPLGNNYYNLLNKNTMQWQVNLMKKYGIDGQCIYHYWFKDGRKILEKPAENLLRWKDIDMPFCFCWANEAWARTWNKLRPANVWMVKNDETAPNSKELLIEQKYGDEKQWREHFDYLLPFFKDDRYIKKESKPVFVLYQSAQISCLGEMIYCWNKWAVEQGFGGIYIIGANSDLKTNRWLDAVLQHEPQFSIGKVVDYKWGEFVQIDYDCIWQTILSHYSSYKNVFYGGFVGYDSSPRCGNKGILIENSTPEKFNIYLSELIAKNIVNGNDMVFINAWNEWGEGMYLEPDEKYKFQYLEAVSYAKDHYVEYIDKYKKDKRKIIECLNNEVERLTIKNTRYEFYWKILNKWLRLKEIGVGLDGYFKLHKIKTIAIYGMGMLGMHLYDELKDTEIIVQYAIDQYVTDIQAELDIYKPQDKLPTVDVIVVTANYDYIKIKKHLEENGCRSIVSLEQIICDINDT